MSRASSADKGNRNVDAIAVHMTLLYLSLDMRTESKFLEECVSLLSVTTFGRFA